MTAGKGRKRDLDRGLEGLRDELKPGRPRTDEDDNVAEVINTALQSKPADGSMQWTTRSLAAATGLCKSTAHRWLSTHT
jgi:putative transposase